MAAGTGRGGRSGAPEAGCVGTFVEWYDFAIYLLVLPAAFLLPETRGLSLLRGEDRAGPTRPRTA